MNTNLNIIRTDTYVKVMDLVTGLHATVEGPHQHKNERKAKKILQRKISNQEKNERVNPGRRKSKKPMRSNSKYEMSDE